MVLPELPKPVVKGAIRAEIGLIELFIGFSRMALSGFGGVMPFAYRFLVERHAWVSAEDFAQMLVFGQILPGPTICNVAMMVGWRKAGLAGSVAALSGMLIAPFFVVILLGIAYQHFGSVPAIQQALAGMSAVAAGLIIATAVKMAMALFKTGDRKVTERLWLAGFSLMAFGGVGLLRWPLAAVVAGLGPLAIALAFWTRK